MSIEIRRFVHALVINGIQVLLRLLFLWRYWRGGMVNSHLALHLTPYWRGKILSYALIIHTLAKPTRY